MSRLLSFFLIVGLASAAFAGDAESDWKDLIALDAGPQRQPRSPQEAKTIALDHLARQERGLRLFLADHSESDHAFDAWLRLARLLTLRGEIAGSAATSREADRIMARLEKEATPAQRADLDFAQLTQQMRAAREPTPTQRKSLLAAARRFQAAHPLDRRISAVLAEVATQFNSDPKTKQALLLDALRASPDDDLKQRINDDLRGVALLGQPLPFKTAPGSAGAVDLADYRGRVVVLAFFAVWSGPSLEAVDALRKSTAGLPDEQVAVIGVSLDAKPERLAAFVKEQGLAWPIVCDGQGWESPAIRGLGVNTLPTVWILDREGRLRSLDGLSNTAGQVRQILRSP